MEIKSAPDTLEHLRAMLDERYESIKNGRVKPVDGAAFFEELRRREEAFIVNQ